MHQGALDSQGYSNLPTASFLRSVFFIVYPKVPISSLNDSLPHPHEKLELLFYFARFLGSSAPISCFQDRKNQTNQTFYLSFQDWNEFLKVCRLLSYTYCVLKITGHYLYKYLFLYCSHSFSRQKSSHSDSLDYTTNASNLIKNIFQR